MPTTTIHHHHHDYLIHTKVAVFLHTISQAGWNRFSSVYLLAVGFTPIQIGTIKSSCQIAKVIAQPIWGILSDVFSPLHALIVSTILGTTTLTGVRLAAETNSVTNLTKWRMIRSAVTAASPAMDALVLQLVEGTSEGYGKQRLWGSIAWGTSALMAGTIMDWLGEGSIFLYTYITSGLLLLFFLALRKKIQISNKEQQLAPPKKQSADRLISCQAILQKISSIRGWTSSSSLIPVTTILLHNLGYGIVMVLFDSILMLQLERDFGISRSVQGIFTMVSIASTIPVYHYSTQLQEKIGHVGMIQSSIIIASVRLILTKFACSEIIVSERSRANWLMLLQLLHGFHFAANWTASVELLDTLAANNQFPRSLVQFLLNMSYYTAGTGIGNLWFSVVYEQQGGQETYSRGLWLCFVDLLLIWLLKLYSNKQAGRFIDSRAIIEVTGSVA